MKELTTEVSPVYTQAMADKGELPSVGMEFIDSGSYDNRLTVCLLIHDNEAVYSTGKQCYQSAKLSECKPLTPPVELIGGKAYQFTNIEDNTIHGIYDEDEHSFNGTCVEWSASTCTNIQPLTVEGES